MSRREKTKSGVTEYKRKKKYTGTKLQYRRFCSQWLEKKFLKRRLESISSSLSSPSTSSSVSFKPPLFLFLPPPLLLFLFLPLLHHPYQEPSSNELGFARYHLWWLPPSHQPLLRSGRTPGKVSPSLPRLPLPAGAILHWVCTFHQILSTYFSGLWKCITAVPQMKLFGEIFFFYSRRKGFHQSEALFCDLISYLPVLSLQLWSDYPVPFHLPPRAGQAERWLTSLDLGNWFHPLLKKKNGWQSLLQVELQNLLTGLFIKWVCFTFDFLNCAPCCAFLPWASPERSLSPHRPGGSKQFRFLCWDGNPVGGGVWGPHYGESQRLWPKRRCTSRRSSENSKWTILKRTV